MQVLLRGSRIMLSDVEAVLEGVPGVEQAVALVQDDPTGAQRLVAYVTPASLDGASVLQQLRGKLPVHLMPASVTPLPQVRTGVRSTTCNSRDLCLNSTGSSGQAVL
jgi:acyl-CoA synthetase (AMP-forming)/AMP-acid ligase II